MAAHQVNITDRAHRYRAQQTVTGPRKCVICGSRSDIQVMHLDGDESHGERSNLAYGCRSCNGKLSAAFKRAGIGRPTNQYNPASGVVPTFEQYKWAVYHHMRKEHDEGGAVIHATPYETRVLYAKMMAGKARRTKREQHDERWNPGWFGGQSAGQTTSAHGGIAHHQAKAPKVKEKVPSVGSYKGYSISKTADGEFYSSLDPQSWYSTKAQVQRAIDGYLKGRENPSKPSDYFELGYKAPKKPAGDWVPLYEIHTKHGIYGDTIHKGVLAKALRAVEQQGFEGIWVTQDWAGRNYGGDLDRHYRKNPASASASAFKTFHGFEPSEVIEVTKRIHHHEHLAAAGKLVHLDVWGVDERGHRVQGFKGAFLAFNEGCNQLFVEGGDQSVNLGDFGIKKPHEMETLGKLTDIGYQTNKTHLGDEGGNAVYVHKFRSTNEDGKHVVVKIARYPDLIYDVVNESLMFSGGSYEILREGIDR